MRASAPWANDPANRATIAAVLVKYTHADTALIGSVVHVHFADSLTPASVQPQIDVAAKYRSFPSFPAQELIGETASR